MTLEAISDNDSLNNMSTNSDINQPEVLCISKSSILYWYILIASTILVIGILSFIFTFTKLSRLNEKNFQIILPQSLY